MKILRNLAFACCLVCGAMLALTAFAHQGVSDNSELRKEIKAYTQKNILPVLRQQRLEFDKQLSAADKQQVEALRKQLEELHTTQKAIFQKPEKGEPRTPLTDAQKSKLKGLREQKKQVMEAAQTLANKYDTQLLAIRDGLADEKATWAADLKAISEKHNSASEPPKAEKPGGKKHKPHARRKHHHAYHSLLRPARFILWDATQDDASEKTETMVYPNPSTGTANLGYAVAKQGNVKIMLLDANGNTVRTLLNETRAKGSYQLEADLSNLASGVYYYRIETQGNSETKRIIKK